MKKKVAIVLPHFVRGGGAHMVGCLAANLDTSDIDVKVICIIGKARDTRLEKEILKNGIEIEYIDKRVGPSISAFHRLGKLLSAYDPDIIHTNLEGLFYSFVWAMFHHRPIVHTLHSLPQHESSTTLKKTIMKYLFRHRKAIPVSLSDKNQSIVSEYYGIPVEWVEKIYNPVETKRFYHTEHTHAFTFITVGRLSEEKNQKMMINAFKKTLDKGINARLRIVGSGEVENELFELASKLKLEKDIEFCGSVSNVEDYLCDADVFLLSSYFEGIPLSILEAMSASLPIISTDVGGVGDIVTDNGILTESDDCSAFAEAMIQLYNNSELRKKMSNNSLDNAKKYDVKVIQKQYSNLYKKHCR